MSVIAAYKKTAVFSISNFSVCRKQLLYWTSQYNNCCFLDNHQYVSKWNHLECIAAVGSKHTISCNAGNALHQLQGFIDNHTGQWIFGHLSYDLKNEIEPSSYTKHTDYIQFPDLHFFVPQIIVRLQQQQVIIDCFDGDPATVLQEIYDQPIPFFNKTGTSPVAITPKITKAAYLQTVHALQKHIQQGDCYEINFCQEFFATNAQVDPLDIYQKLSAASPNPFAAFYRLNDKYLLCASPERFLLKKQDQILSQPIKGTIVRKTDPAQDEMQKKILFHHPKERSENVMITDLVRNDLSKVCTIGSVQVDELFEIYTYPQVHQMISTISGMLDNGISFTDIIRATYPMGSMTGAPKKRVMELIDQYECTKRGLFSGALGYISPEGDFDFNVVIRSIFYNSATKYLSYQVGSAITFYSDAEKEYEECLLKAAAIEKVLQCQNFNPIAT